MPGEGACGMGEGRPRAAAGALLMTFGFTFIHICFIHLIFFNLLTTYVFVLPRCCVCVWAHMCDRVNVEVRSHLLGVCSFFA